MHCGAFVNVMLPYEVVYIILYTSIQLTIRGSKIVKLTPTPPPMV